MDKPLNPDFTFKHISVHMIHILARLQAKRLVQEQLRNEGVRVTLVPPRVIAEKATALLASQPEIWREAITRAHLIDAAEGRRKEKRKLRSEQLARHLLEIRVGFDLWGWSCHRTTLLL